MPVSVRVVVLLVAAFAVAGGGVGVLVWRDRRLRRALAAAEATRRLMEGVHERDVRAFERRIRALSTGRHAGSGPGVGPGVECGVLSEADAVLDAALAAQQQVDPEGGE